MKSIAYPTTRWNYKQWAIVLACLVCTNLLCTSTWAGVFSVSPLRIQLDAKSRAVAVTVTNDGDEELVMQADLYLWKQKPGGEEDLALTEDVFLSPPIFKIPAKSRQVLRLAMLQPVPTAQQLTYRVILREIVEARPAKEGVQVQVALAFSIPIFITPPGAKHLLECDVKRVSASMIKAVCENKGNAFVLPRAFALINPNGVKLAGLDSGGYILPGIERSFEIKSAGRIPPGKTKLTATLDDTTIRSFDVTVGE
jgi:fimbrial chaperone protein